MLQDLSSLALYGLYALPLAATVAAYVWQDRRNENRSREIFDTNVIDAGREPASLHPVIDPARCFGCGACVHACPEGKILGLIDGKAALIEPTACIGHGACKTACPADAIALVFGTARRGFDIPEIGQNFETNVPGIFIAGELGGMGLIRNAVEQGKQAIAGVAALDGIGQGQQFDVVIVGAGPAGFAASLAAKENKLRAMTLEQASFGGTVAQYPRGKIVMTEPADFPIYGRVKMRRVRKERLLELWQRILKETKLPIRYGERVQSIEHDRTGFLVTTNSHRYKTRAVVLAMGRRGTPKTLGIPGEDLPNVVYALDDPAQYSGKRVVVVGGGDSALEAAASLSRVPGCEVALVHRGTSFERAKPASVARIEAAAAADRLIVLMESRVMRIAADRIEIETRGRRQTYLNDTVIICAGGVLPAEFLRKAGIRIETVHGKAMAVA